MKGKHIVLFILLIIPILVYSQEDNQAKVGFGDSVDVYVTRFINPNSDSYIVNVYAGFGVGESVGSEDTEYLETEEEVVVEDGEGASNSVEEDLEAELLEETSETEEEIANITNLDGDTQIALETNQGEATKPTLSPTLKKTLRSFLVGLILIVAVIYLAYNINKHKENKRIEKDLSLPEDEIYDPEIGNN